MLNRLRIRNFQSLEDIDLELGQFTVIIGESDTGKSAIIRALKYALINKVGTGFIRHGEKQAAVELTFEDLKVA